MSDDARFDKGMKAMETLFGRTPDADPATDDFTGVTVRNLFGDIWNRPGLSLEERSMITVTALLVLGRQRELRIHLRGAKNIGIPREKIDEMVIHLAHYGGWPVAASAAREVAEIYSQD